MSYLQPKKIGFIGFFLFLLLAVQISEAARIPQKMGDGFLALRNIHLNESLSLQYRKHGHLDWGALGEINKTLRCRQTHEIHEISPQLVELVDEIQDHFGGKEIQVLSGYRSPQLNENLRRRGRKVAKHSLHMRGQAMDIRIPGVSTSELRQYALSLKKGGVGFYPRNGFVHVDIGRVRQW